MVRGRHCAPQISVTGMIPQTKNVRTSTEVNSFVFLQKEKETISSVVCELTQ